MTQVQNRVAMKQITDGTARGKASGYERAWSTIFWFGRDGLAEIRPSGDGYEGHLLTRVGSEVVHSESVFGSLPEVKAALLAAVEGHRVVQDKSARR
jgi:hypothetical protein